MNFGRSAAGAGCQNSMQQFGRYVSSWTRECPAKCRGLEQSYTLSAPTQSSTAATSDGTSRDCLISRRHFHHLGVGLGT